MERVLLDDGSTVVAKWGSRASDWVMDATADEGRLLGMFREGVFDRMPSGVETAIIAVEEDAGEQLVVMHDVGHAFVGPGQVISAAEVRRVLRAADAVHRSFDDRVPTSVCALSDYLALTGPEVATLVPNNPAAGLIGQAWQAFLGRAPADIGQALLAVFEHPTRMRQRLDTFGTTLAHGDLWPPNMGFTDDDVVLIDWGTALAAPGAFDLAYLLVWTDTPFTNDIGLDRDSYLSEWRSVVGDRWDDAEVDVCTLLAVTVAAPGLAFAADDVFTWWMERTRAAVERTWSPI